MSLREFADFRKYGCGDDDYNVVARISANNVEARAGRNRSWPIASDADVRRLGLAYVLKGGAIVKWTSDDGYTEKGF